MRCVSDWETRNGQGSNQRRNRRGGNLRHSFYALVGDTMRHVPPGGGIVIATMMGIVIWIFIAMIVIALT